MINSELDLDLRDSSLVTNHTKTIYLFYSFDCMFNSNVKSHITYFILSFPKTLLIFSITELKMFLMLWVVEI